MNETVCPTCRDDGRILHVYDRPGGPPGNQYVGCPDCAKGRAYTDITMAKIAITVAWSGSDHYHLDKLLGAVIAALSDARRQERERGVAAVLRILQKAVEIDPKRRGGIPVLKGTRFTVGQTLAELADSAGVPEVANRFDLDETTIRELLYGLALLAAADQ